MDKNSLKKTLSSKMDKAIEILDREFSGLRTNRASINLLDSVIVECYNDKMHLNQLASVSTPDSRTIQVQVWDKKLIKAVEKAIVDSNLGVNPVADGQVVSITIPPLNEERRKELIKIAYKYSENAKISIRNVRRHAIDDLKLEHKNSLLTKDELYKLSEEAQKCTDDFCKKIDVKTAKKEVEILEI
ncbi:MAG: ribosome recycling factor [Rickettsiaceae bacterium]